ncbi:MAG: very short patch repair endonuclease [Bacteroidota bacterium]
MVDVFSKKKRSDVMSRIRGRDNKETEGVVLNLLRRNRINGWRRHSPIFGKPDFVFYKKRVALFVDGCFWHSCPQHSNTPANNRSFWLRKFETNRNRDRLVTKTLRSIGWRVLRIWEHELTHKNQPRVVSKIGRALNLKTR